jgi:hypothetical protein
MAVLDAALAQLPRAVIEDAEIVLRSDSVGAAHDLLDVCRDARICFFGRLPSDRPRPPGDPRPRRARLGYASSSERSTNVASMPSAHAAMSRTYTAPTASRWAGATW